MAKGQTATESTSTPTTDVVQLTRNVGDRQIGETFRQKDAEKLGILDHCQPFPGVPGQNDRAMKPKDITTR